MMALTVFRAEGAERFVVHGSATGQVGPCRNVIWRAVAILHNRSDAPVQVRLLSASEGAFGGTVTVQIPAGESRFAASENLAGIPTPPLWVTRLDVPDGIGVEGRLELYADDPCSLHPPVPVPFAKISMPVFDRLAAAREVQEHFGADLGSADVRLNVGVYNAGVVSANVTIRALRPLCAQPTAMTRTATIAANTIAQIALPPLPRCDVGDESNPTWSTEVTVEADQPSLSFVSVLSTETAPAIYATVIP